MLDILAKVVKLIPKLGRWLTKMVTKEEFFSIDQIYNPFTGKVENRLILLLPGRGCAWYKLSGGCTMCGFSCRLREVNEKWKFTDKNLISLTEIAINLSRKPDVLCIYNGGSFLNPNEIALKVQLEIARRVKKHPTINLLFIESRPEFIQRDTIYPLQQILDPKLLEIGIGLEAVSEKVRNYYIRKGLSLHEYERAVRVAKSVGAKVLTYVLLKPPGLSEGKAIKEAKRTIEYALEMGSDEVSLSCTFVQEGTLLEELYKKGKYHPPWLWSIVEVVKETYHLAQGRVRIGSFFDEPPPIATPANCGECDSSVLTAIKRYNYRRKIESFFHLSCRCRDKWKKELEKEM